ncbi:type II toxin-antitoxin system RelE family toxin [Vibrio metschnikovii]|uniref:type II toxin-antitoxin system RelE family toxin n=1 Tax=Vibrio metschnikovii TaxID=28172 RepID=UPI003CCAC072
MTYKLGFKKSALKEWKKLGSTLQQQFKKKLIERLENPHVPASKLSGADNMYKIKLRQSGYRLVYQAWIHILSATLINKTVSCHNPYFSSRQEVKNYDL